MRNKFKRKGADGHSLGDVFINPAQVFGVVGDGYGGSFIHSSTGFYFIVAESPEVVDRMLRDDNEN
jgi:hypothetical protein